MSLVILTVEDTREGTLRFGAYYYDEQREPTHFNTLSPAHLTGAMLTRHMNSIAHPICETENMAPGSA